MTKQEILNMIIEIYQKINEIEEYEYLDYQDTNTKVKYVSMPEIEEILNSYKQKYF